MQFQIRFLALLLLVLGVFVSVGCGGGGGSDSGSTPTPTPTASGLTAVQARYVGAGLAVAGIEVSWSTVEIPQPSIVEYQVYRDGALVGAISQLSNKFLDRAALGGTTVSYNRIEANGQINAPVPATATVPPLTAGVPHVYRVQVLYTASNRYFLVSLPESAPVTAPAL